MGTSPSSLTLALALLASIPARADLCGQLEPHVRHAVLRERLYAHLPDARAVIDEPDQTRLVVALGDDELSFTFDELHHVATGPLERDVRALLTSQQMLDTVEVATLRPRDLELVTVTARGAVSDRAPLLTAFIRHPDGSVLRLLVHGRIAPSSRPGCVHAVEQLLAHLQAGPRRVTTWAGPHSVLVSTGRELIVTLPDGYVVSRETGDANTRIIRPRGPLGAAIPKITIVVGRVAQFVHRRAGSITATERPGPLMDRQARWFQWSEHGRSYEELIHILTATREGPVYLHIWIEAASAEERARMRALVETLVVRMLRQSN